MKLLLLIFILLIPLVLTAQPEPDIVINDFSGGLNTNTSLLRLQPNQGNIFLNWDIGEGYLTKRKGYLQLLTGKDTVWGDDPTSGIFAIRRADGVGRIYGITSIPGDTAQFTYWTSDAGTLGDSSGCPGGLGASCDSTTSADPPDSTGYGMFLASPGLPATPPGSGSMYYFQDVASRVLYNYVYQGVTPHWTYWNDRAYMTNGRQRPLVFHPYNEFGRDGYVRELVPLTPGEPLIVPLDVSGNLNGEYYYMLSISSDCGEIFSTEAKFLNGEMEAWTGNLPDNWDSLPGATGRISENTDTVKAGNSSLKVLGQARSGNWGIYGQIHNGVSQGMVLNSDTTYIASVWVWLRSDGGSANITVYDTSSRPFSTAVGHASINTPTDTFVNLSCVFSPLNGKTGVVMQVYLKGSGGDDTCYFDSAAVRRAEGSRLGVVTKPVTANDENVLFTNFPWQSISTDCDYGKEDTSDYDNLTYKIYRTKANPGTIRTNDNFFLVKSLSVNSNYFGNNFYTDTLTWIDTIPDDTLGLEGFSEIKNIDSVRYGRDSSLIISGTRVGAPTYIKSGDGVHDIGYIFLTHTFEADTVVATSYMMTYYDTLINAESDSGRSLFIARNYKDSVYVLGIPPVPGGKAHFRRKIYRATYLVNTIPRDSVVYRDTTIIVNYGYAGGADPYGEPENEAQEYAEYHVPWNWINSRFKQHRIVHCTPDFRKSYNSEVSFDVRYYADTTGGNYSNYLDTTMSPYRLIGEISGSDSVFVDSITYDSSLQGKFYFKSAAPYNLNGITSFNGALFGFIGSSVKWSYLDTGTVWGSFNDITLNPDDGDVITAILPMRDYIKVYKNMSQYAVFPGTEFAYERLEAVEGLGCIAPHSAIATKEGIFYLSHEGVVREQGSEFRDIGSKFSIISEPINNLLLNRTTEALRKGYSYIHKSKYHLAFADIDTTFVYHLKTGGWTISDYAAEQAIPYDTLTGNNNNKTPSTELVFIMGSDDFLYKADTLSKDSVTIASNGTSSGGNIINTKYRSAPFGIGAQRSSVNKMGLWRESNDATGLINIKLIDAEGDTVFADRIDTVATRYDMHGVGAVSSNYFQWEISDSLLDSLAIDRIDTWIYKLGEEELK